MGVSIALRAIGGSPAFLKAAKNASVASESMPENTSISDSNSDVAGDAEGLTGFFGNPCIPVRYPRVS